MDIKGKNVVVLGGHGLVGMAVCRQLIPHQPARLVCASRQTTNAAASVDQLRQEFPGTPVRLYPVSGDVFLRAAWQDGSPDPRAKVLSDAAKRTRLIADILDPLDDDIIESSLLSRIILGTADGLDGVPADIVIDCMNTATVIGYQNIYTVAKHAREASENGASATRLAEEIDRLVASSYLPQLARHVQILYEAMRRAGSTAYVKVGTTGTGGMGFNIPYTHGEERPSRLLLAKAAIAGGQTLLTFLMARTPGAPRIVKEIKPGALIAWKQIGHGAIRRGQKGIPLHDCLPDEAVSIRDPRALAEDGDFGRRMSGQLEGAYIDTGENGLFSAAEFTAITAAGQMTFVTPEEIAHNVIAEIAGRNTGHDVVAALDASVMGPSYRAGFLREAALNRLRHLEEIHGESVAFELLGPPRLSKLLFEAHMLKRAFGSIQSVLDRRCEDIAAALEVLIRKETMLRQRILSIGIPILLADGDRLLRGPRIKAAEAHLGWVDLTPGNMTAWQSRLSAIRQHIAAELATGTSSRDDRLFQSSRDWVGQDDTINPGEIAAWIFNTEDRGRRGKT